MFRSVVNTNKRRKPNFFFTREVFAVQCSEDCCNLEIGFLFLAKRSEVLGVQVFYRRLVNFDIRIILHSRSVQVYNVPKTGKFLHADKSDELFLQADELFLRAGELFLRADELFLEAHELVTQYSTLPHAVSRTKNSSKKLWNPERNDSLLQFVLKRTNFSGNPLPRHRRCSERNKNGKKTFITESEIFSVREVLRLSVPKTGKFWKLKFFDREVFGVPKYFEN